MSESTLPSENLAVGNRTLTEQLYSPVSSPLSFVEKKVKPSENSFLKKKSSKTESFIKASIAFLVVNLLVKFFK